MFTCLAPEEETPDFVTPFARQFRAPVTVTNAAQEPVSTIGLFDNGSTGVQVDQQFAIENQLPIYEKPVPEGLRGFDGSTQKITLMTQTTLDIHGHSEPLKADLCKAPAPVVLGMPWFKKHNPEVNWKEEKMTLRCSAPAITFVSAAAFKRSVKATHGEYFTLHLQHNVARTLQPSELPEDYHDYADVFDKEKAVALPPQRPGVDHAIPVQEGKTPPFGPIYGMNEKEAEALRQYIKDNLSTGRIRNSSSPAGAPVLFVKKPDGSLRLCVDYRGLNEITTKDRGPLPLISETLDRLNGAKLFTKLDLKDAYNRIRMKTGEEWKTAFRTRYGLFEYCVMPMGLTNAPATFQSFINNVLREFLDDFAEVYLDDILIHSKNKKEHKEHVQKVLQRLREAGLYCSLKKCHFSTTSTEFLGFIVSTDGISMDPKKIEAIMEWEVPRSVRDVQCFIGFANFYRRFIEYYSKICKPMFKLMSSKNKFEWTKDCQEAFETLKVAFTTAPILIHFDPAKESLVETDASNFVTAGVISQRGEDGHWHPIAFRSKKMTPAECNYEIHDKELLAIIQAFQDWRQYLEGARHTVRVLTDHKNLEYFKTKKQLNDRQARWNLLLATYDFKLEYRPGKLGGKPDALTRRSTDTEEVRESRNATREVTVLEPRLFEGSATENTTQEIKTLTLKDEWIQNVITAMSEQERHRDVEISDCTIQNGLLYIENQLCIPDDPALRLKLLQLYHDHISAGHPGRARTLELISRQYYWKGLRKDVDRYVDNCHDCKRNKAPRNAPHGLLKSLQAPDRNWKRVSMDFIVGLPPSCGFNAILVVVCRLSKMAHFIATRDTADSLELARLYRDNIWKLHGLSEDITSDRGPQFVSDFWRELCTLLKIDVCPSTAYHPQTDGQTERVNGILEQYLRAYVSYDQDNWMELLPMAEFGYNNLQSQTTGLAPFAANYGFNVKAIPDLFPAPAIRGPLPDASTFASQLSDLQKHLQEEMKRAQLIQQEFANRERSAAKAHQVGDHVFLDNRFLKKEKRCKKLDTKLDGPFKVEAAVGPRAYKLKLPPSMKCHPVFHTWLLHPAPVNPYPGQRPAPPPPVVINNEEHHQIQDLLDSRKRYGHLQYLVRWVGYDRPSWEFAEDLLEDAPDPELYRQFHQRFPEKPRNDRLRT
jgi:hypothetical protein